MFQIVSLFCMSCVLYFVIKIHQQLYQQLSSIYGVTVSYKLYLSINCIFHVLYFVIKIRKQPTPSLPELVKINPIKVHSLHSGYKVGTKFKATPKSVRPYFRKVGKKFYRAKNCRTLF